ncbi:MAG: UvrB/UvrC motif-containing protein, partial [bacterium]|nr:UvrB/UvrC motif-containing protein [bacterium]
MIPKEIKIKNKKLPDEPGVYFYYGKDGRLLYIGKATSLKRRVGSYFTKQHIDPKTDKLVGEIARIDYIETPTVIEALVLEANQIRVHKPPFNLRQLDDKSFSYLVITKDKYPKPLVMRGLELERLGIDPFGSKLIGKGKEKFSYVFGPYLSAHSLKLALDLLRKIIPWSDCDPNKRRPCFYAQIGKCPGVCTEAISVRDYKKYVRDLVLFFSGKKPQLIRSLKGEMDAASKKQDYELAAKLRNRLFALQHIRDVALITREETLPHLKKEESYVDLGGRVEAYDISNISGTSATGSMVVFFDGKPAKKLYRKFKIKTVEGPNDVAMMEEMIRRRLARAQRFPNAWPLPEIMVIDGGKPQVNRVQEVLNELNLKVPIIGLAKGFDRKQDELIYDRENLELRR